ncbi:MAG: sigma factor-like helix-turn-helix DNA-binding protein, partial [Sulfolobales archaeon]
YREVLYLRYYQHLKIKEISKKLNIPEKTVSTYINRGLKELRYYLQNTKANKIKKIERNF